MARIPNATEPNQPKLGERWLKGAWLGRRAEDNAHLALTERGLIHARAVKALPEAERFERARYSSLRWEEQGQRNPEPLESFWAVLGKTPGCYSCSYGGGKAHTAECRERQETHRRSLEQALTTGAAEAAALAAAAALPASARPASASPPPVGESSNAATFGSSDGDTAMGAGGSQPSGEQKPPSGLLEFKRLKRESDETELQRPAVKAKATPPTGTKRGAEESTGNAHVERPIPKAKISRDLCSPGKGAWERDSPHRSGRLP